MANPNPKTDHLKPYQKEAKLKPGDTATMKDMIRSGTSLDAFIEIWHDAGITYSTARVYYYRFKKQIAR